MLTKLNCSFKYSEYSVPDSRQKSPRIDAGAENFVQLTMQQDPIDWLQQMSRDYHEAITPERDNSMPLMGGLYDCQGQDTSLSENGLMQDLQEPVSDSSSRNLESPWNQQRDEVHGYEEVESPADPDPTFNEKKPCPWPGCSGTNKSNGFDRISRLK